MDWNAIGAMGEVIGAAAVVISIVYLATQVKQNTRSAQLNAEREIALFLAKSLQDGASSDIGDVYMRGTEDVAQLSDGDATKFGMWVLGFLRYVQYAYDQRCENHLSDRTWESIELMFKSQLASPGVRAIWAVRGDTFKKDFRDYVDGLSTSGVRSPFGAVQEARLMSE